MRRFENVTFLFLVIITTIDASRIFYLPLPKIHSSHHESESSPSVHESVKQTHEQKSINDEFIPISAMERNMYEEQEEDQKRDFLDWEPLLAEKVRHHILVHERSHGNEEKANYMISSNDERRLSSKTDSKNDDLDAAIDSLSQNNGDNSNDEPWQGDTATARVARLQSNEVSEDVDRQKRRNDALFLVIVGTCSLVGVVGLVAAAIFWYKIQKRAEAALDAEYPSYGVTGPNSGSKISPSSTVSDRKLAQSAQMFHYQQQRQQMMAQEKAQLDAKPVHSDDSDDEAPNGGDYTVYECPGLAPTGEMEVRNPLFTEPDSSLTSSNFASHPTTNNHYPQLSTASPSSSPPKEKSLS
jgi:hypothetical protein